MSKRMSVAVMAVTVLVFIAACGSNATPMPTPASPAATHTPSTATPTVSDPDSVQATLLLASGALGAFRVTDFLGSIPARAGEPLAVVYTSLLSHKPELYLTAQKAVFSLPALSLDAVGPSCT